MEYKTLKEVKKSIYEKKWYCHWRYFLFYCWWNWIEERPRAIKRFFQRGWRGWADEDTWNFDLYLARVIAEGVRHHKKYQCGIPSEYFDDVHNHTSKEEKIALKRYYENLDTIIKGFETYIKMCNNYKNFSEKKYIIQKLIVLKGIDKFKDNFHNLND
jgi:hypothetical protein